MSYSKGDVVLLPYPFFTDLSSKKVRTAVVISAQCKKYDDLFIIPLTSKTGNLEDGEFLLKNWREVGLNVPTAVKRGCVLISMDLIIKKIGQLDMFDINKIKKSLKLWLEI